MIERRSEAGFTLVEVLFAAVLLAGAVIASGAAAAGTAAAFAVAELDEGAVAAAEQLCDSLLSLPGVAGAEGSDIRPPYRLAWRLTPVEGGIEVRYVTPQGPRMLRFDLRLPPPIPVVEP